MLYLLSSTKKVVEAVPNIKILYETKLAYNIHTIMKARNHET